MPHSSSSVGGSILLCIAYGYVLLKGAQLLSDGSEMLLEVLNPGVIGGAWAQRHAIARCANVVNQQALSSQILPLLYRC